MSETTTESTTEETVETTDGAADQGTETTSTDDDAQGAEALGDAGKQALDRMKEQRNAARAEARAFKALGMTPDQIKALLDTQKGEGDQPDADAIRRDAEREATSKANQRILRSEVKAAAAGKLADPHDALTLLDLDKFEVGDDGEIDEEEIADAIDDLLKKKPYLAAQGKRFQGEADGGTRNGGQEKSEQLTRDDLKRMSPTEIVAARKAGRLNDALGIKS